MAAASASPATTIRCKTLTKVELTAIENAGLSVFVVFQHCGAQCVNFDLQNKETAEKGRKDAGGCGSAWRTTSASPPTRRFISPSTSIRRPGSDCPLPAARIWPSIDAYFDQINEVLAQARAGRSASMARASRASASRRAARQSISGCRHRSATSARRSSSTAATGICSRTSSRSSEATRRNTFDTDVVNPATPYFGQWTSHGPAAPHRSGRRCRYPGEPRLREKSMRDIAHARQREVAHRAEDRARSIRRAAS